MDFSLRELVERAVAARVDFVQIREKDLTALQLCDLVEQVVSLARGSGTKVLVNDRFDIALAYKAHGVHLPSNSLPVRAVRKAAGSKLIIGVSTHSLREARRAERDGADYILFGPVFSTPSKIAYGPPVGLAELRKVVRACRIPVIALGGINMENFAQVVECGVAGIAGISLFISSNNLRRDVARIRRAFREVACGAKRR